LQTSSATTLDLFLLTSGDRPSYGAMMERRDGLSWLCDDDDDDDDAFAMYNNTVYEWFRPITYNSQWPNW